MRHGLLATYLLDVAGGGHCEQMLTRRCFGFQCCLGLSSSAAPAVFGESCYMGNTIYTQPDCIKNQHFSVVPYSYLVCCAWMVDDGCFCQIVSFQIVEFFSEAL